MTLIFFVLSPAIFRWSFFSDLCPPPALWNAFSFLYSTGACPVKCPLLRYFTGAIVHRVLYRLSDFRLPREMSILHYFTGACQPLVLGIRLPSASGHPSVFFADLCPLTSDLCLFRAFAVQTNHNHKDTKHTKKCTIASAYCVVYFKKLIK